MRRHGNVKAMMPLIAKHRKLPAVCVAALPCKGYCCAGKHNQHRQRRMLQEKTKIPWEVVATFFYVLFDT
jgi:hypothetical protein